MPSTSFTSTNIPHAPTLLSHRTNSPHLSIPYIVHFRRISVLLSGLHHLSRQLYCSCCLGLSLSSTLLFFLIFADLLFSSRIPHALVLPLYILYHLAVNRKKRVAKDENIHFLGRESNNGKAVEYSTADKELVPILRRIYIVLCSLDLHKF